VANYHLIIGFLMGFVINKYWTLNMQFYSILVSDLIIAQFIKCITIWKNIKMLVVSVDIWS